MAKRVSLSKSDRATPVGAALLSLCQRITEPGKLTEQGIKELIAWLRNNRDPALPAKEFLTAIVVRIVSDRTVTKDELRELHAAIESVMPRDARAQSVLRRKELAAAKKQREKLAKEEQKKRAEEQHEQAMAAAGIVLLTAANGRKYQLHSLIGEVEYGRESLEGMAARLGNEVAAVVAQHVKARERQFTGTVVRETEGGAWLFRVPHGGDFFVPIQGARIVSGSRPGPLVIAVPPSLAADIDRQLARPRNMLEFTALEVAQRFNVSVDTVRKWIRDGHLAAGSVGNGSAAFEYRISEEALQQFARQFD